MRLVRGDLHRLPLRDGAADRARTDRVLQHVAEPRRALGEIRRVLRRGGRLVSAEPDWETLAIDYVDVDVSRAYTRFVTDRVIRNPAIGRQIPRLAVDAGLRVATEPFLLALTFYAVVAVVPDGDRPAAGHGTPGAPK